MTGELTDSKEYLVAVERRKKIAAFITDVLQPAKKALDEHKTDHDVSVVQEFESRSYQLEAWDSLWQARAEGKDKGLLHLATGLGKTSVAVFDYAKFRSEQVQKGQPARALFVVHQNNILEQAKERFEEVLPDVSTGFFRNSHTKLPSSDVTFASFQSLTRGIDKLPADRFDYIVYDEAHHIEAKTYKTVVEHFKPAFQLGLTATPERMDEKQITDHFGKELYRKTLPEAIAEGHLATVNYNIVSDNAVQEAIKEGFNPSTIAEIQRLFDIQPRNEEIVYKILEAQEKIKQEQGIDQVKTIVFCADMEHADEIAALMGGESYHSGKSSNQQDVILSSFRDSELDTITVRDMFNEGVDIPDARLIVFLRTTQSPSVFEQQLGRGLRKDKHKQEVTVLDFVANIERIALIRQLSDEIRKVTQQHDGTDDGKITPLDRPESNLNIYSDQSEFIFTQEIVDLLDKYNYILERIAEKVDWSTQSNDELIQLAKQLQPQEPLTISQIRFLSKENKFPSTTTIVNRFGLVTEFQRQCGFDVYDRMEWKKWSNQELIDYALELSPDEPITRAKLDLLSRQGIFISSTPLAVRFGSISNFQRRCGFEVREQRSWNSTTNQEIVDLAKELSPKSPLSTDQVRELSSEGKFPSMNIISQRFGSIYKFQTYCGFEVIVKTNWRNVSDEEIINKSMALSPEKALTSDEINEFSKQGLFPSQGHLEGRFGSLNDFNSLRGFNVAKKREWKDITSKDDLVRLALEVSPTKAITEGDMNRLSKIGKFPSKSLIKKYFSSLGEFQKACGFEPSKGTRINMDTEEIVDLAKSISPDEPLTVSRIKALYDEGSFPSLDVIQNRFGSVSAFQKACGFLK